jgi:hypothetical protein
MTGRFSPLSMRRPHFAPLTEKHVMVQFCGEPHNQEVVAKRAGQLTVEPYKFERTGSQLEGATIHRQARKADARGGRAPRREGGGLGLEKHGLCGGGARCRLEAQIGRGAWREGPSPRTSGSTSSTPHRPCTRRNSTPAGICLPVRPRRWRCTGSEEARASLAGFSADPSRTPISALFAA